MAYFDRSSDESTLEEGFLKIVQIYQFSHIQYYLTLNIQSVSINNSILKFLKCNSSPELQLLKARYKNCFETESDKVELNCKCETNAAYLHKAAIRQEAEKTV